jgi:hypothetical protein
MSGVHRWTFELIPEGDGTQVRYGLERLSAPLYFRVMQPLMWRLIGRKMLVKGLNNIKARVEAGAGVSG